MLMESPGLGVVNDVVFGRHPARPLIKINSPPAVIERLHVVNQVVMQHAPRRQAERINPAHVAEHALADVVDMIPRNRVVM